MVSGSVLFFLVVAGVGGTLLALINRPRARKISTTPSSASASVDVVDELLRGEALSGAARRQWLDRLLEAQQSSEEEK